MALITYYTILGVPESASFKEIQKAYREKALAYHPDINKSPDATQIFIRIQKAYEVLSDPDRRFKYDNDLNDYREKLYKKNENILNEERIKSNDFVRSNQAKKRKQSDNRVFTWRNLRNVLFILFVMVFFSCVFFEFKKINEKRNELSRQKKENIDIQLKLEQKGCVKRTYDILNNHYDIGTIDQYVNRIQELKYLRKVYDTLTIKYHLVEDFDAFSNKMQASIKEYNYFKLNQLKTGDTPYKKYYKNIVNHDLNNYILVKNSPHSDVVVLLENIHTKEVVRNIYIKSGVSFKIRNIPEGVYALKCMYGNNWNPQKKIGGIVGCFDSDLSFSKTDRKDCFDMNVQKVENSFNIPNYEVTLYKIRNGNLTMESINADDFFNY